MALYLDVSVFYSLLLLLLFDAGLGGRDFLSQSMDENSGGDGEVAAVRRPQRRSSHYSLSVAEDKSLIIEFEEGVSQVRPLRLILIISAIFFHLFLLNSKFKV